MEKEAQKLIIEMVKVVKVLNNPTTSTPVLTEYHAKIQGILLKMEKYVDDNFKEES